MLASHAPATPAPKPSSTPTTPTTPNRKPLRDDGDISTAAPTPCRDNTLDASPFCSPWQAHSSRYTSHILEGVFNGNSLSLRGTNSTDMTDMQALAAFDFSSPVGNHSGLNSSDAKKMRSLAGFDFNSPMETVPFCDQLFAALAPSSSPPLIETLLDTTPPATPRKEYRCPTTPPPHSKLLPPTPSMKALRANSPMLVQEALVAEPDAAREIFWDHSVEPPLCFAARHSCNAMVVELLLQHGADPDALDVHGKCPADHIQSIRRAAIDQECYEDIGIVEQMLKEHSSIPSLANSAAPQENSWSDVQPSWALNGLFEFQGGLHPWNQPVMQHAQQRPDTVCHEVSPLGDP